MAKMPGYVLPPEAATAAEATTFPGFPGVYMPGIPVSLSSMRMEEKEADALLAEMGLPLKKVQVNEASADYDIDRGGHAPSEEVAVTEEPGG